MQSHYFLAVPLPKLLKQKLNETYRKKNEFPFKRWVHKDDLHLTLVFLGACTQEQLEQIKMRLESLLFKWSSFSLELSTLGTFGPKERPRIFWIGIKNQPLLDSLRQEIFEQCEEIGFSLDKRGFSPHITLARKWVGQTTYSNNFEKSIEEIQRWNVNEVILYKSVMTEEPKYKVEMSFQLGRESI
ncbi:RNA 2',3'-cyclic phosphodiesterase [Halalkalibacter kiskunsagensis]|uniref:RNA 2',3'-cyclic phosphodiesterase n=1 Tax=Halalkalibacter kiskunsagensis TaxID=1548599 RepID=A0ABV6KIN3_9BACI